LGGWQSARRRRRSARRAGLRGTGGRWRPVRIRRSPAGERCKIRRALRRRRVGLWTIFCDDPTSSDAVRVCLRWWCRREPWKWDGTGIGDAGMAFSEDDCTGYQKGLHSSVQPPRWSSRAEAQCEVGFVRRGDALVGPLSPYGHCAAPTRDVVVVRAPRGRRGAITFGPWRAAEGDRRIQAVNATGAVRSVRSAS